MFEVIGGQTVAQFVKMKSRIHTLPSISSRVNVSPFSSVTSKSLISSPYLDITSTPEELHADKIIERITTLNKSFLIVHTSVLILILLYQIKFHGQAQNLSFCENCVAHINRFIFWVFHKKEAACAAFCLFEVRSASFVHRSHFQYVLHPFLQLFDVGYDAHHLAACLQFNQCTDCHIQSFRVERAEPFIDQHGVKADAAGLLLQGFIQGECKCQGGLE